jgi:hypothetical protein
LSRISIVYNLQEEKYYAKIYEDDGTHVSTLDLGKDPKDIEHFTKRVRELGGQLGPQSN